MAPPRRKPSKPPERKFAWRCILIALVTLWLVCLFGCFHMYHPGEAATHLPPLRNKGVATAVAALPAPKARVAVVSPKPAIGLPAASGPIHSLSENSHASAAATAPSPPTQPPAVPAVVQPPVSLPDSLVGAPAGIAATSAWIKLLGSEIQVDYMRERMRGRQQSWLQSLAEFSPAWEAPKREDGDGINRALIWPAAAYQHFGVTRVWSLGEYAQWADLCAALATLGFEVILWPWHGAKQDYPKQSDYDKVNAVFTDYDGIHGGWRHAVRPPPDKTWILDTFGTDGTVVQHGFFGRQPPLTDYPLGRFLTLVPEYAKRNNFLGVAVVGPPPKNAAVGSPHQPSKRKWQCVLWSKVHPWLMWTHEPWHKTVLQEFTKHCHVIATVDKNDTYKTEALIRECCPEVEIRGVATTHGFQELLHTSAVYVGVGEPLIAPSCFEALSLGTHVVQPRFPKPKVLANKPITQAWTSQHPFLEQVPEPFAYSINPLDPVEIAEAFKKIKQNFNSVFGEVSGEDSKSIAELTKFYDHGEYPMREVYSMAGFLGRVAKIVRQTVPLVPSDWDWEREAHPDQLPKRAFQKGGAFGK